MWLQLTVIWQTTFLQQTSIRQTLRQSAHRLLGTARQAAHEVLVSCMLQCRACAEPHSMCCWPACLLQALCSACAHILCGSHAHGSRQAGTAATSSTDCSL